MQTGGTESAHHRKTTRNLPNQIVLFIFLLGTASCTYHPPQVTGHILNARAQPRSHILAIAVKYEKLQWPSGINAFPNGGVPRMLEEEVRIYICDVDAVSVKRVVALAPPGHMKHGFEAWVLGWSRGKLFFQISGQAGTSAGDYKKPLHKKFFAIDREGGVHEVPSVDHSLESQSNTGPLPSGKFLRISHGHDTLDVKTESLLEWRTLFRIDPVTGELVASMEL